MRVIVTLEVPAMGDDFQDDQRRRDTRELRDRLLARFASGEVQLVKTMELSGQVVLEIDADALADIENAPEVRAVAKERRLSPFTGE